ncbi:protein phosphatase 1 regulatory subunit 15 [Musca autumnalis]|uniref:protein phosphatase 1 regulatory subunit 15 n=1 Tax=Musca autumnalis TaxID=221902 RepID=UPI003CEC26A3
MIGNNHRNKQPKQLLNCLGLNKMSTTALKAHHHTAAMAPSFEPKNINASKATRTMSSLAADLCKVATAAGQAPPMEAAVVVNSIIYSKPSFCSIVVDIGGKGAGIGGTVSPPPMPSLSATSNSAKNNNPAFKPQTNKEKTTPQTQNPWFSPPHQHIGPPFTGGGYFPMALPTISPPLDDRDAHVYMMCTTMNGSINHQISDLCDNLIAMGSRLFGMANSEHDDDSVIEFGYDDNLDDLKQNINFSEDEEDDDDDDEEDYDDEDEVEDEEEDDEDDDEVEYKYDDDDDNDVKHNEAAELDLNVNGNCLHDDGVDVVDFIKSCPYEKTPNIFCDKKKKVRFNTKPVVHVMHTWNYAYRAARKGNWEMYARDRARFKMRIDRTANVLNRILEPEHRQKIFEQRFAKIDAVTAAAKPQIVEKVEERVQEETPKKKQTLQPPPNANTKAKKRARWKKRMRRRPKF